MKLLSVDLARSLWFGHTTDFNPRGISLPAMALYLAGFYKFKKLPTDAKEAPAKFADGEFVFRENEPPVSVTFEVYPEGVISETRHSTDCSDVFLSDLFTRLSKEFNIPSHDTIIRQKKYVSQLYVSMDKSLSVINPKLQEIASFLSENSHENGIPFELGGISFWPEQAVKFPPWAFVIERAVNAPFSEGRYFSRAPLETEKHLELLSKLESILS